ncbi:MAG: ribosome biogenesis GTPase Der [Thiotrichales bacterium]
MRAVIALVGRPNVGKSTLFNQLTRTRDALVADFSGLTRDRQYGIGRLGGDYLLIDTGGLIEDAQGLDRQIVRQTEQGIAEADRIIWLLDGRDGLAPGDHAIAQILREAGKPVFLAINKTDGIDPQQALSEFYALGFSDPIAIAASHGRGLVALMTQVLAGIESDPEAATASDDPGDAIRIAFVGRPNVGKSTLVNRLLGEERVVVSDLPGTTRDSIAVPFERDGQPYVLIDTAGVRRRSRVDEVVEKFSVVKTLAAIEQAHVVIHVLDAHEGVTDQDAHLIGLTLEMGRALVVALNKWDGLRPEDRERVLREFDLKLSFIDFAERFLISALHGSGVGLLFGAVRRAHHSATLKISTTHCTQLLERALTAHQPPLVGGRRIKLRYAHQGGRLPPLIVIHGNQTERLPEAYRRYLNNSFRSALKLVGTPLRLEFKTGENPFAGRRNPLTPTQQRKRARLLKHVRHR